MKKLFLRLLLLCLLAGAVFTGLQFYRNKKPDWESEAFYEGLQIQLADEIRTQTVQTLEIRPDFKKLKKENPDIIAWIYSPGTAINYPVVQGNDNQFYLEHLSDRTPNRNGSIFMDFRNRSDFQDPLTVLYGHHIRGGRMFSSLREYRDPDYYEEHPSLFLYTPETAYEVSVFAGVVTDAASETFPLDLAPEKRRSWLQELKNRSDFWAGWEPTADGNILALCTCTYEYNNARYVIYGQLKEAKEQ